MGAFLLGIRGDGPSNRQCDLLEDFLPSYPRVKVQVFVNIAAFKKFLDQQGYTVLANSWWNNEISTYEKLMRPGGGFSGGNVDLLSNGLTSQTVDATFSFSSGDTGPVLSIARGL